MFNQSIKLVHIHIFTKFNMWCHVKCFRSRESITRDWKSLYYLHILYYLCNIISRNKRDSWPCYQCIGLVYTKIMACGQHLPGIGPTFRCLAAYRPTPHSQHVPNLISSVWFRWKIDKGGIYFRVDFPAEYLKYINCTEIAPVLLNM